MYRLGDYDFSVSSYLSKEISGKKVLYVPMYSMRDYDTGAYDLSCDGNVNRFLTMLSFAKDVDLVFMVPANIKPESYTWMMDKIEELQKEGCLSRWNDITTDCYGLNALETRKNYKWLEYITNHLVERGPDILLFEPNVLTKLFNYHGAEPIYWLPVSSTADYVVPFLSEFTQTDRDASMNMTTVVASDEQHRYFSEVGAIDLQVDNLFLRPEFFVTQPPSWPTLQNVIFLPFRLTDDGYKFHYLHMVFSELYDDYDFEVWYTDPNNAMDEDPRMDNKWYVKVSKDRNSYYKILSQRPIIPYLDNPDVIQHASPFEFAFYNCRMVYVENHLFRHCSGSPAGRPRGEIEKGNVWEQSIKRALSDMLADFRRK
jgi:hypothetical protein